MSTFLVRSFTKDCGYEDFKTLDGKLPRSGSISYVPWAIVIQSGKVVYAKTGEHTSWRGGTDKTNRNRATLKPYDTQASQDRRRLCETILGMAALEQPQFSRDALQEVSASIKRYLLIQFWKNQQKTKEVVYDEIGHYFFTGGRMGFGRISEAHKSSFGVDKVWIKLMDTLTSGRVDQIISLHDAIGRKVLPKLGGTELIEYKKWGAFVRQDWFDDSKTRGRINSPAQNARQVQPTVTGGTVPGEQRYQVPATLQKRNRGIDMFQRDLNRTRHPEADNYYDDMDVRNLLFGAGISGTTGTLLQAAKAFGKLNGEAMKQYLFAIIGYLIGGGMHSYHESMVIAAKVGVPYTAGTFLTSLPASFLNSPECKRWIFMFYDVTMLGGIHWRYNPGVMPSHLNTQLRQCRQFVIVGGADNGKIGPIS